MHTPSPLIQSSDGEDGELLSKSVPEGLKQKEKNSKQKSKNEREKVMMMMIRKCWG